VTPAERKWKAFNDLMRDWRVDDGEGNGVEVAAFADGVFISGWYDSCAAIEGGFLTWAELDELRRKAKDRPAFAETPLGSLTLNGED